MSESPPIPLNFSPLADHLAEHYGGDPQEAAASLYRVGSYLVKVPHPTDTAATLREVVGIVNNLAAVFDTIKPGQSAT